MRIRQRTITNETLQELKNIVEHKKWVSDHISDNVAINNAVKSALLDIYEQEKKLLKKLENSINKERSIKETKKMRLIGENNGVYTDKNGIERQSINYYLVLTNGLKIAIKPVFNSGYKVLQGIIEPNKDISEN